MAAVEAARAEGERDRAEVERWKREAAAREAELRDREEALHLLDILFSQENPSAEALQLGIEIHEALQPESQNFWLSAWLRNEAEKLGKRLKAV